MLPITFPRPYTIFLYLGLYLLSLIPGRIQAQEDDRSIFVMVACWETKSQDASGVIQDMMQPFFNGMVAREIVLDWQLYSTHFTAEDCRCDLREVIVLDDPTAIDYFTDSRKMFSIAMEVFPDADPEAMGARFDNSLEFVYSEVYALHGALAPGGGEVGQLLTVNYMQVAPEDGEAYVANELEVWAPLHQARKEAGKLQNWAVLERVLPHGTGYPSNFMTVDVWGTMENMVNFDPGSIFEEVHPGKDPEALAAQTEELRELYRSEMWRLLYSAEVPGR